jgi:hypothetical protein
MLPEHHIILNPNYIERIIWIVLFKMHQYLKFHASLMLKPFFVSYQLYRHILISLMIEAFDCLTEAPLAKEL